MLRIGLFIRSLNKGGSEKQAILLSNFISRLYSTSLIAFTNSNHLHSALHNLKIKPFILEGNLIKRIIKLYRYFKEEKITHLFNYLPSNNIIGSIVGKLAGVKYIFGGVRGTKRKSLLKTLLVKYIFKNICTKVISNSNAAKKLVVNSGVPAEKIVVIHNGIEIPENNKQFTFGSKNIKILSIGRFIVEKDFITALESIAALNKKINGGNVSLTYNIVGYGPLKYTIEEKIKSLNISAFVNLYNETDDVESFYKDADIYLSTSIHEGMSNTIMEALSYSLPVVCTDVGDSGVLVIDSYNGFLCPPKDSNAIASSLGKIISDEKLRKSMSENAYAHITENFSIEKSFAKYISLIEEYGIEE